MVSEFRVCESDAWATERAHVLGDVGRVELRKDLNLLLDVLNLVLCALEIYDLYGNGLLSTFIVAE